MSNQEFFNDLMDEAYDDYDENYSNFARSSNYLASSANQQSLEAKVTDETTSLFNDINLSNTTSAQPAKKRRSHIDYAIAGLMGQANMSFASGDYDTAITTCMEVIRHSPHFSEPFLTLATIYDEKGESEKSLQFSLIGAHLAKDINIWLQVSDKCFEAGKNESGLNCFEKACRCSDSNSNLWKKLLSLLTTHGAEKRKILETQKHYMDSLKIEDGDSFMQMARIIFKSYHEMGADDKALEAMALAIAKHPDLINTSDINLLLDFYISKNAFTETLAILVDQCGVELSIKNETEVVVVPENTPVDLVSKLCVCLTRLRRIDAANSAIKIILEHDINSIGDIYLEIAESLLLENYYSEAESLFKQLVATTQFNQAEVWLRFGECLYSLKKLEAAADAYQQVVHLAPNHIDARITLSLIYQELNQLDKAIEVLCQADKLKLDNDVCDSKNAKMEFNLSNASMNLVLNLCSVLLSHHREEEYILVAFSLILFLAKKQVISKNSTYKKHKSKARCSFVLNYKLNSSTFVRFDDNFQAIYQDLLTLYKGLFDVLYKRKDFQLLNDVTYIISILPPIYYRSAIHEEFEFLICLTSIFNKNFYLAHNYLRYMIYKYIDDENKHVNRIWNLFSINFNHEIRINNSRFFIRLALKNLMNIHLCTFNGHSALYTGSYKHALSEYFTCMQLQPANPLFHLMIGITLIHISNHKLEKSRANTIIQAFVFFNQYLDLRGECQESLYNLGRAMHQFQFYAAAISFYERALKCPPIKVIKCPCCPTHCPTNLLNNTKDDHHCSDTNDEANNQSSVNTKLLVNEQCESLAANPIKYDELAPNTNSCNVYLKDVLIDTSNTPGSSSSSINILNAHASMQHKSEDILVDNNINEVKSDNNIYGVISEYCSDHCPSDCPNKPDEIIEYASLDLTKEIAYNLYELYLSCGSFEMATFIVQNYLVF